MAPPQTRNPGRTAPYLGPNFTTDTIDTNRPNGRAVVFGANGEFVFEFYSKGTNVDHVVPKTQELFSRMYPQQPGFPGLGKYGLLRAAHEGIIIMGLDQKRYVFCGTCGRFPEIVQRAENMDQRRCRVTLYTSVVDFVRHHGASIAHIQNYETLANVTDAIDVRPFKCPTPACQKLFARYDHLQTHLRKCHVKLGKQKLREDAGVSKKYKQKGSKADKVAPLTIDMVNAALSELQSESSAGVDAPVASEISAVPTAGGSPGSSGSGGALDDNHIDIFGNPVDQYGFALGSADALQAQLARDALPLPSVLNWFQPEGDLNDLLSCDGDQFYNPRIEDFLLG
ncbi:hypothetical protein BXZ70DRAFT_907951 [Cristinia sonorae]|uniref:C2H2-type domain-containing protein n=1 Tax=Cristinia sonorae TaxID=1940300 RepID=A0A8K0UL62_9AGAR|nr:hypothetical protein BXZ70DRAFT_907951 [Cristinia sonorae]